MNRGLEQRAAGLARRAGQRYPVIRRKAPSGVWLVTDPDRTLDLLTSVEGLPRGSVVIYRAFGAPSALVQAISLRHLTRRRGLLLLIGADAVLARKSKADGVHLPQRLAHLARRLKRSRPGWVVTAAAHGLAALRNAEAHGVDAVLVSAAFASRSASAGPALGPVRFEHLARQARGPVIALGGVNARTAARLQRSCAAGLAGVEGF